MSSTATPRGLVPVQLLGGTPFAGSVRQIPIKASYGTKIYNGDVVGIGTGGNAGHIVKDTVGSEINPIGVFLGCSYTDPNSSQPTHNNMYPGSISSTDIMAVVSCDPNCLYEVQATGSLGWANFGQTIDLATGTTGNDTTGNSNAKVDHSGVADAGKLFRIIDMVTKPGSAPDDTYTDIIVMFNPKQHAFTAEDALDDATG